jgi:tetratricopeptide (TPR) repeat protein
MGTRDLLLLIGFLRTGKMFPTALPLKKLPVQRSLKLVYDILEEQEQALFGAPRGPADMESVRRRAAITSWSGEVLSASTKIGDVRDPGVLLCLLYDVPAAEAPLPVDVFAQTLRRYALRDPALRAKFDEHVDEAGTFVPSWLSPESRRQKSQEAFDAAMKVAREQGFAQAAPLLEGVRGDLYTSAQIAIAIHELRELGDADRALERLNEVIRVSPHNIAARMARAGILRSDAGRRVEAASDYLFILREIASRDSPGSSPEVYEAASEGLWALHREFASPRELDAAVVLAQQEPDRGFEALSRYVHTHPCSWDAQAHLASLALARQRFDLSAKLLHSVRWLFPLDPNPHFVYGQAIASKGHLEAALRALEYAASLAPGDPGIVKWVQFVRRKLASEKSGGISAPSVSVADHVARSLFVVTGLLRDGRIYPSASVLHKLPGDVSLSILLQGALSQEQRRFNNLSAGMTPVPTSEDLRSVAERSVITSYQGFIMHTDQTVGDVPDPGVVLVLLYPSVRRDDVGRPMFEPPSEQAVQALLSLVHQDAELAARLDRHLRSADASLKARLELEG